MFADAGRPRPGLPVDILHLPGMYLSNYNLIPFNFHFLPGLFGLIPDARMLVLFPPNDVFPKSQSIFSAGSSPGNIASSPPLPFLGNNLHPPSHLIILIKFSSQSIPILPRWSWGLSLWWTWSWVSFLESSPRRGPRQRAGVCIRKTRWRRRWTRTWRATLTGLPMLKRLTLKTTSKPSC